MNKIIGGSISFVDMFNIVLRILCAHDRTISSSPNFLQIVDAVKQKT